MYFRQLRLPDRGCASYIVGGDGVCAVVDPRWDAVPQYLGLARQQGFTVTHILDTHTHADHVSGATRLAARTGATMPLKDVFGQPETMWMQFRRRLDRVRPYCRIASHTETEVHDIILALERMYQPSFPELNLRQWTGSIYTWLTHPLLDPQSSGRVIMDNLMKLVTTALELSYAEAREGCQSQTLRNCRRITHASLRRDSSH